jgi:hypothetical protein
MILSVKGIYKGRCPLFDNGGYTRGSPLVGAKVLYLDHLRVSVVIHQDGR